MSDQSKATREKYSVNVEEHLPFEAIAVTKFITSAELAKAASELFKNVFADFEGCVFEAGNGEPTMSLIFNHGDYSNSELPVACERIGGKVSGSTIIDRTRLRDRQMKEGDRYYPSDDGKDVFSSLIVSRFYNGGNIDWKKIVSEWTDRTVVNYYNQVQTPQYTKISFIDLRRLCGLIYGTKIDDDTVDYGIQIASIMPTGYQMPGMASANYMLNITRASSKEVTKTYEKLGLGTVGSNIVR